MQKKGRKHNYALFDTSRIKREEGGYHNTYFTCGG